MAERAAAEAGDQTGEWEVKGVKGEKEGALNLLNHQNFSGNLYIIASRYAGRNWGEV